LISEDPSADNTDTYAFRSPDRPDTVSIISNYIPGEDPAAGPNWYTFSPSARYVVYADKNGDGKPDVTWRLPFQEPGTRRFSAEHTAVLHRHPRRGEFLSRSWATVC